MPFHDLIPDPDHEIQIGLLISMFTAITFTRTIVNLIYGHKKIEKISVGI